MNSQHGGRRPNRKRRPDDQRGGVRTPGPGKRLGRPPVRWSGVIGAEASEALSVMALQDAVAAQIEQQEAAERLVSRLIMEERARRIKE